VQVTVEPTQLLPEQASLYVQSFESLQAAAVRQAQVPPALVQRCWLPPHVIVWHSVCVEASQVYAAPPPHEPTALLSPHPAHVPPVCSRFVPQLSAQLPAAVPQPAPELHVTVQHWLPPPTAQVVWDAEHEQVLHTSPPPEQYRVQLAG
jgi:hypothetical protein